MHSTVLSCRATALPVCVWPSSSAGAHLVDHELAPIGAGQHDGDAAGLHHVERLAWLALAEQKLPGRDAAQPGGCGQPLQGTVVEVGQHVHLPE